MTLSTRNKYLLLATLFLAVAFGAFMIDRSGNQASAGTESADPPLSVIDPISPGEIAEQPDAVRKQLDFMADGVAARATGESVEVTGLGETVVPGQGEVSVAEVGEEVCAFQMHEIGSCADEAEIAMGRIFTATPVGCHGYDVLGIVGNDVESIQVSPDGEANYSLGVNENIYLGTFKAVRTLIEGLDASGNTVFTNLLPLDEYRAQNDACQTGTPEVA